MTCCLMATLGCQMLLTFLGVGAVLAHLPPTGGGASLDSVKCVPEFPSLQAFTKRLERGVFVQTQHNGTKRHVRAAQNKELTW